MTLSHTAYHAFLGAAFSLCIVASPAWAGTPDDDYMREQEGAYDEGSMRFTLNDLKALNIAVQDCRAYYKGKIEFDVPASMEHVGGKNILSAVCADLKKIQTIDFSDTDAGEKNLWRRSPGARVVVVDRDTLKIIDRHFSKD